MTVNNERLEYLQILRSLGGDPAGKQAAVKYVEDSDCYIYGRPAPFAFVPAFYTAGELEFMRSIVTTTHRILGKVIRQYVADAEYRKLFHFPADVERLVLLPCNYEEPLPIARFDFFLNEEDRSFKFCEFNADGAAAMSRTQIGCEAVEQSDTFREFARRHKVRSFEYFDTWASEFLKTYHSDKNAEENPHVLITDFADAVTMSDITRYLKSFEKLGVYARFVDIRKLAFDGEHLTDPADGTAFHAVYRRAVTSDIAKHVSECQALIDAVAAEKAVIVGHFRTTVVHSKMIGVALLDEQTKAFLTEDEWLFVQNHILPTYRFRSDNPAISVEEIARNKDAWILKPEDDYDSHGVFAGKDHTPEEWEKLTRDYLDRGYVAMVFFTPCKAETALPYSNDGDCGIVDWYSMTGTFSFNGTHYGFFNRMGAEGVISESHGGVSIPAYEVLS